MADPWTIAGALGEVISSVGAVSAVLIAVITQRRQGEDQRRSQASQVTLDSRTLDSSKDDENIPDWARESSHQVTYALTAENLSKLPIFKVAIYAHTPVPPISNGVSLFAFYKQYRQAIEKLGPGSHFEAFHIGKSVQDMTGMSVWFTDAAGIHWERKLDGALISHRHRKDINPNTRRIMLKQRLPITDLEN